MRKFLQTLVVATVAVTGSAYGQYAQDAIKFSETSYGVTSRFKAMGGAQIGVGGDLSSLGGNPAGLGLFTRSEFSLTPEFSNLNTHINYLGQGMNTTKGTPNLNQFGVAFYLPNYKAKGSDNSKGLLSMVVGIGYNRVADYINEYNYSGTNPSNSIADYFAELGGNTPTGSLDPNSLENWAYQNYLISYDNVANNYYPETYVNNMQTANDVRKGSTSELNFSLGLNISNQIYVGANVGLVSMRYTRDAQYIESGIATGFTAGGLPTGNTVNYRLLFNQSQTTSGEGLNGRIGIILRPVPEFRVGATIQTPTWMEVTDNYIESLDNRATPNGTNESASYDYIYKLRTPLKSSIGASYVIGNTALISADVDYIDYTTTRISSPVGDFQLMSNNNAEIRNNYQEVLNFRVGGEIKLKELSIRGGYAYNASPVKDAEGLDTKIYSAGLGYRVKNYYVDATYQRVQRSSSYSPYVLNNYSEPVADITTNKNNVAVTVGVRF